MNTMKFPREFVEQLTHAQRMELIKNPMKFAAALHDFDVAREGDAETTLDAPKPASAYVDIPDWLEAEIRNLDTISIHNLAVDLIWASRSMAWQEQASSLISDDAIKWLKTQSRGVFKALLQWVAMELI
jgi:hypothetical protein